jgi:hypothetical protein
VFLDTNKAALPPDVRKASGLPEKLATVSGLRPRPHAGAQPLLIKKRRSEGQRPSRQSRLPVFINLFFDHRDHSPGLATDRGLAIV